MTLYTADRLAEMLGVQKSTVQQLVRAGEFGPTVNVARKHLVTEDGLAGFIARRTGPAHSGLAPAPQTNYHHRNFFEFFFALTTSCRFARAYRSRTNLITKHSSLDLFYQ